MNKRNYQRELDGLIESFQSKAQTPRLFLHACCAPCSSYVLEYLSQYFSITVFYYNPNISPESEYTKRIEELKRFVAESSFKNPVTFMAGDYRPEVFYQRVKGLEDCPEGSERCFICYRIRMEETAKLASQYGFGFFTTTLSISPLKNAEKINEIGEDLAGIYKVRHLPSDFKKKEGYKRSVQLSEQYGLYRQDYCGCVFSKRKD